MVVRQRSNKIDALEDESSVMIEECKLVEKLAVDFFKKLYCLPSVRIFLLR